MSHKTLRALARDIAWSHWTGLGVNGVAPPPDTAVDPEALVLLTAVISEEDPRLLDEAWDWCRRYARRFLALGRLKTLAKGIDAGSSSRVHAFSAVVNALAGSSLPSGTAKPPALEASGKSRLTNLDTPARSLLRLRCVFGVNARAEILLSMLSQWSPQHYVTASALTELGYVKSAIASTLEDLMLAGLMQRRTIGNANAYQLRRPSDLRGLLEPMPLRPGDWHLKIPLLIDAIQLEETTRAKSATTKNVEARKFLDSHASVIARLALPPPARSTPQTLWDDLARSIHGWFE